MYYPYLAAFLFLYTAAYCFYLKISHGLGHKAEYLQLRRFFPCALLAVLPAALASLPLTGGLYLSSLLVGLSWIITYPSLYYLTNWKISSDFGFHLDIVFGLYIISWLTSLKILVLDFNILPLQFLTAVSLVEFILLMISLSQWCYYFLYGTCADSNGMLMVCQTDCNEIIEFIKSFSIKFILLIAVITGLFLCLTLALNLTAERGAAPPAAYLLVIAAVFLFLTFYLWKKEKGVFVRTGIIALSIDAREYLGNSKRYRDNIKERLRDLSVAPAVPPFAEPSTIILVIGESASRDYMSAFSECKVDSTPWLRQKKDDPHFILFPNTYSSATYTLPSLEMALTESSQYNDKEFFTSVSIMDIAKKAGYKTYWYSNQGHICSDDTPVTLIAETADTAQWTKERINQVLYDESLLDLLSEIDPKDNNFVVLHLKGSHFNFITRYPEEFTRWGEPGRYDLVLNYLNSLAYTDYVLEKIYDYAKEKLNLKALLYFSDHGMIPDRRRSPNFQGFAKVRIPMFVYFSDEYISRNKEIYETLKSHRDYYFTTDLAYELICSILNITSNHFDETGSLASQKYRYTREMLKTDMGRRFISEDNS